MPRAQWITQFNYLVFKNKQYLFLLQSQIIPESGISVGGEKRNKLHVIHNLVGFPSTTFGGRKREDVSNRTYIS
ncbi:MAG: hypothetical protein D6814_11295 [Calditrichaeota bacterium]|nr:MAG: hypothetical protein D6814_11295 [Calditrichota bacterium]